MTYIEAVRELDELAAMIGRTRDAEAIRVVLRQAAWMRTRLLKIANVESLRSDRLVARDGLDDPPSSWPSNYEALERNLVLERESRGTLG